MIRWQWGVLKWELCQKEGFQQPWWLINISFTDQLKKKPSFYILQGEPVKELVVLYWGVNRWNGRMKMRREVHPNWKKGDFSKGQVRSKKDFFSLPLDSLLVSVEVRFPSKLQLWFPFKASHCHWRFINLLWPETDGKRYICLCMCLKVRVLHGI